MHGAALDWVVLCTMADGPDLPTGEGFGAGLVRDHEVYRLTKKRRTAARWFARILDIGSLDVNGCMFTYDFLGNPSTWLDRAGGSYIGVDLIEGPNVDCTDNSHDLKFRDGSFDLVLCLNMLEHDDDGEATLRECWRVLEPGGEFVLTCTNEFGAEHAHLGGGNTEFFRHWPAADLLKATNAARFEKIEHWTHGGDNLLCAVKR